MTLSKTQPWEIFFPSGEQQELATERPEIGRRPPRPVRRYIASDGEVIGDWGVGDPGLIVVPAPATGTPEV